MIFENVKEVEIKAVNGKLNIEGWEQSHVEVDYTRHGEVDVEIKKRGDKLIIKEEPKKRFLNLFGEGGWAEINLKVPKAVVVNAKNVNGELKAKDVRFGEVTTVNGRISLEDCEAEKLSTVNGRIRANLKVAGPLKASTVNGNIEITLDDLEGDVEVSTVNGGVALYLTDFCDARITAKAVNGGVHFVGIDPENPVIGTGDYEVKVSTVNGSVRVELV
ncbi:hypothetical protein A3L08_07110 [Thermococcus pacificus]|uniref:DUF4097 domain-containing protein n=2 Tax=Thermococcus pacificus TaxID=71998 RepID=A0A218P8I2_9EURY|nr:DUF4097 family beta strand repeat-containing protein [Thermococcus pacificus]ASJ07106.1 hypothetical protein A3L08_07110 [Thermococcus pacificus]